MMNRSLAILLFALSLPLSAAPPGSDPCRLCSGVVLEELSTPPPDVPLLFEAGSPSAATDLATLPAGTRARVVLVIQFEFDPEETVDRVERDVTKLIERFEGTKFAALGLRWDERSGALEAYALKRLATLAQGRGLTDRIVVAAHPADLISLYAAGAGPYFDLLLVPSDSVEQAQSWRLDHDPVKRIAVRLTPRNANPLFDVAEAFAGGAELVFVATATERTAAVLQMLNREMADDFAFDSSASIEILDAAGNPKPRRALSFVRGSDLRTLVIPETDRADPFILSLEGGFEHPRRIDAGGARVIHDHGVARERFLVGLPPSSEAFFVMLDRPALDADVAREAIEVVTESLLPVEEIIRNHQSYWSLQESIRPRYIARNETDIRFDVGNGETIEATLAGDHFLDRDGISDWAWEEFFINGVRWRFGQIPELPLVQPEKVTQLPLDIHLTQAYRYHLVRRIRLGGHDVFEVSFRPPEDAPPDLPLYRGTVWIDTRTWSRIAISMVQMNLSGEVLSNEERVEYAPFDRFAKTMLTSEEARTTLPSSLVWLPVRVEAQQVLSTAGRATAVIRSTELTRFRLAPDDFEQQHRSASVSDVRMVRETDQGLRYLERTEDGTRVVKEGFDTASLFLLGGVHHDPGLEFPVVPLGGIDYFNFDLGGRGLQTNVFFAGVIVAANLTDPSVLGTRTNAGVDLFGIAIPFENAMYRDGEEIEGEAIKTLPASLTFRAGHPLFGFGKADLSLGLS
ncbi:MAG TPA: hypothetical protein VM534_03595, partial [Thermoanaerobaculia bacterium]|nr:hypothetical protein [Thermoanaerobaculia bacterium]